MILPVKLESPFLFHNPLGVRPLQIPAGTTELHVRPISFILNGLYRYCAAKLSGDDGHVDSQNQDDEKIVSVGPGVQAGDADAG